MEAKGKNYLRISGILELLIGIANLALLFYVMNVGDKGLYQQLGIPIGEETIIKLFLSYGMSLLCVIAGLIGIAFANSVKHAKLCLMVGYILMAVVVAQYGTGTDWTTNHIISLSCSLIVPAFYIFSATLNKRS